MRKDESDKKYLSQYSFYNRAQTRQLGKDLSFRYKKYQEADIGNLTLLKTNQLFIPTSFSFNTFNLYIIM